MGCRAFRTMVVAFAALAPALTAAPAAQRRSSGDSPTVVIQLLAINDVHGNLEPPAGANGRIGATPAGGTEYLGAHLARAVADNPNSLIVAAGDLIGASPLLSALFGDEPTLESMDALRLSVSSVGNHEFDKGWQALLQKPHAFTYLSANVTQGGASGPTLFPPSVVRTIAGVKIGFIGETLKGTPRIVTPDGVRGLSFLDEAQTANRYAADLRRQGVGAIVLLIHEGLDVRESASDPNGCANPTGGLLPVVEALSADIKVVVSGHTHEFYNCTIDGHVVTSASSYGRMLTRVNLTIDRTSGAISSVAARNEVVDRVGSKDAAQTAIIAKYAPRAAPVAARIVGSVRSPLTRRVTKAGESALGDVIADAQLAAASSAEKGGAVIALMNPGGIRADVGENRGRGAAANLQITYGDLFTSQPFGNTLTVLTITGDALHRVLEQQFDHAPGGSATILQISNGFRYAYTLQAPPGRHVDPRSIRLNGRLVSPAMRVRVVVNNYLAAGGDGFKALTEGTEQLGGDVDVDALVQYFEKHSPVDPGPQDRIMVRD